MAVFDSIPLNGSDVPFSQIVEVGGQEYEFIVLENFEDGSFSVEILKNGVTLITSKIVLGRPLSDATLEDEILSKIVVLNLEDETLRAEREDVAVTKENLGATVRPYVII